MFVLAHLSDPHLGPLPAPRLARAPGQAGDRLHQLAAQAPSHPSRRRARAHRGRSQGAGARPHRGDRRSRQHLAAGEYPPALRLARIARAARTTSPWCPAITTSMCARPRVSRSSTGAITCAATTPPMTRVSIPAPARAAGADRIVDRGADRAVHGDGTARRRAARPARARRSTDCAREGLFRVVHDPSSADQHAGAALQTAGRRRRFLRRAGAARRGAGHPRPRSRAHSLIELKGPRGPIPVVGVPSASEAPPGEHDRAGYNLYRVDGEAGAWRCEAISRGLSAGGDAVVEIRRTEACGPARRRARSLLKRSGAATASDRTAARRRSGSRSPRAGRGQTP